jgi:nucleotide-binding universal stress UspA family protein
MFKKILYPTDFSDVAKSALAFIKQFKDAGANEVVILHVLDKARHEAVAMYPGPGTRIAEIEEHWKADAMDKLRKIADELEKEGFKVKIRLEIDSPFRGIVKVEEDEDVSVTIIGSHGISNIQEMFLGSVAEKVIRKAKRPVFVVKRYCKNTDCQAGVTLIQGMR